MYDGMQGKRQDAILPSRSSRRHVGEAGYSYEMASPPLKACDLNKVPSLNNLNKTESCYYNPRPKGTIPPKRFCQVYL